MVVSRNILSTFIRSVIFAALNASLILIGAQKESDTLAIIGKKIILAKQFEQLYKKKLLTVGLTDNGEARMKYLQNLVDDEILIARAKKMGLDKTAKAQAELKRIQLQELLNAFVVKHISGNVTITENDLKEFFILLNTKVKVRHLYAQTKEKADVLYRALKAGKTFEQLAQEVFADPVLKNNGGDLGYISVDEMDPAFEKAAFAMKVGEISKPVKTVQGYSIIHVVDKKANPLLTEYQFAQSKERLRGFVKKRKLEEAAKNYTTKLRKDIAIQCNAALLSKLFRTIQKEQTQILTESPSALLTVAELRQTAVSSTVLSWTGRQLIEALSAVSESQRKWIKTEENFEDFIAGLLMRHYLAQKAEKEKLNTTPHYYETVQHAFDTYLLTAIEEQLKQGVSFSRDSLYSYYTQHKEDFMTPAEMRLSGILLDRKEIADTVEAQLKNGASFQELAKQYSIQTHTASTGGDLGFFRTSDVKMLGEDIVNLQKDMWSGPLSDNGKYLFLKCTDIKPAAYQPFEECAREIQEMLTSIAWFKNKNAVVDSFKSEIYCKVYPERVSALSLSLSN